MGTNLHPAPPAVGSPWKLWGGLVATAALWLVVYQLNGPWWEWAVFDLIGFGSDSRWGSAVEFFFYDTVKILLLLAGIIFAVTVLRSFMSVERTRALLGGRREGVGNVAAAGLGVVTPFCSCSAVPGFIGFVAAGVPLGITMSFLIASPMVNEVAIVLLYGLFGWKIAALYVTAGLVVAILAGWVIGRLRLERWVEPFVFETTLRGQSVDPSRGLDWSDRFGIARDEVRTIIRRIWPYLLVGIGIGAAIHGWVPEGFFIEHAGPDNPLAVPVAVGLGIPLYSNAAGILPLVEALHAKGLAIGTVLAFMMSVVALSLPEMVLLRRVLKPRLLGVFVGVVAVGILTVGFVFNLVL
ncbi:MAG: permease [Acidimicrobiia bacterium]|nr:permease [Acidimicrobiia bacterium]